MFISFLNKYDCVGNQINGKNKPSGFIFHTSTTSDTFRFVTVPCSELLDLVLDTYLMKNISLKL